MLGRIVLSAAVLGIAMPVFAHPGHAGTTGFMHPLSGLDAGIGVPAIEPLIAASVLILGLLVAAAVRLPLGVSIGVVGLFGVFHGLAHGVELNAANATAASIFGLGFVAATALLHLTGVGLAQVLHGPRRSMLVRGFGGAVTACGLLLLGGSA